MRLERHVRKERIGVRRFDDFPPAPANAASTSPSLRRTWPGSFLARSTAVALLGVAALLRGGAFVPRDFQTLSRACAGLPPAVGDDRDAASQRAGIAAGLDDESVPNAGLALELRRHSR